MMLPIKVPPSFRIIAHRGASAYAPENTAAAFQLAAKMGLREIELDTQLSADGEVVLCHDTTLERYGHGQIEVEKMRWPELARLDMGSWFSPFFFKDERMITLNHLFEHYGDQFFYHIELKGKAPALPEAVHGPVQRYALSQQSIITSFSEHALEAMHGLKPALRLGWLIEAVDEAALLKAQALGLFQLCPRANRVNPQQVTRARQTVTEVRAWGLNGPSLEVLRLIHQVLAAGCDGLTLNWPDWVSY